MIETSRIMTVIKKCQRSNQINRMMILLPLLLDQKKISIETYGFCSGVLLGMDIWRYKVEFGMYK